MIQTAPSIPRVLLGLFLAVAIFLAFNAAIFHSGYYNQFISPYSSTGNFNKVLAAEQNRPVDNPNQVLTVGDSRMALNVTTANQAASGLTYGFAGIQGTQPRVWHYLLRELDPNHNRYAAILLPVENYSDEDWEIHANRSSDLRFLITVLSLSDLPQFTSSYTTSENRNQAALGILLKGTVFKNDLQDFLTHPLDRLRDLSDNNGSHEGHQEIQNTADMRGLIVNWKTMRANYPATLTTDQRRVVDDFLLHPTIENTGNLAAYRRLWFGRIIDQYRNSRTKLIFYQLPRGAAIRPDHLLQKKSFTILDFREKNNVIVLNQHLLEAVEKPEYFADALHLNVEGSALLTKILTDKVREVLAP